MAGVFGCISTELLPQYKTPLNEQPSLGIPIIVHEDQKLRVGLIENRKKNFSFFRCVENDLIVCVHGLLLLHNFGRWNAVSADQLATEILHQGDRVLNQLDGFFSLMVYFGEKNQLIIMTDPSGCCPVHYCSNGKTLWFAPSSEPIIKMSGIKREASRDGLPGFLLNGYPLGQFTMYENILRLRPGQRLKWSKDNSGVSVGFYRDLDYSKSSNRSTKVIADELYERVIDAQKTSLLDEPESYAIALTGGYDSRTLLGAMCQIGKPPGTAFTWGVTNSIKGSDPVLAEELARISGVPHQLYRYNYSDFITNAWNWLRTSELLSDNFGHYAAGPSLLDFENDTITFLGDHILGNSGFPQSRDDAIAMITGIRVDAASERLVCWMPKNAVEDLLSVYDQQIRAILKGCNSDHPKDIQHYLEFHLGTFGWLLAPGYYKEPIYPSRRPLLLGTMLDFSCQLSPRNRIGKTHLLKMLKKYMPELYRVPKSSSISLVDWNYYVRTDPELSQYCQKNLSSELFRKYPWLKSMDEKKFDSEVYSIFNQNVQPVKRRRHNLDSIMRLRDQIMRHNCGRSLMNRIRSQRPTGAGPGKFRFIQRLIQLGLFEVQRMHHADPVDIHLPGN